MRYCCTKGSRNNPGRFRHTGHDPLKTTHRYFSPGIRMLERFVADSLFSNDRKRCCGLVRPGTLIGCPEKSVCIRRPSNRLSDRFGPLFDSFLLVYSLLKYIWSVSCNYMHGHSSALLILFSHLYRSFFNGNHMDRIVYHRIALCNTDDMGFTRIYALDNFQRIPLGTPWPHTI